MKRRIFFISLFCLVFSIFTCGIAFGQSAKILTPQQIEAIVKGSKHTLQDYGLSANSVKYFTVQQLRNLLSSKTPAETIAAATAPIKATGTPQQKAAINNPQSVNASLPGTVDCFSYYNFGSVQSHITSQSSNLNPGENVKFAGTVNNQNGYPIVAGTLYVKILRQRGTAKDANGPDVVDQFIAADNIIIPAKGAVPVSFSWKVPNSLTEGNYKVASFFTVDKKFNLLGLSFTNDVIGNTFDFKVISKGTPQNHNVQFDEAGVKINNSPYFFAAFPPDVRSNTPAVVSAKINNSTNNDETVNVVWKLYNWDSIGPNNLIRTESATSYVRANSSNTVKITIPEAKYPVYYLVGELTYKDSKSIVDIRFVRPEVDKLKLNFPSVTSFPIKDNSISTMFSCLYNSGTSDSVPGGKITLKLTDNRGKTIDEYTYQGPVTGNMMAVKKDLASKGSFDHFFLTAQLWQSNKLVDEATLEYDCNKIDPKLCNLKNAQDNSLLIFTILGIVVLLVVGAAIAVFIKQKNRV